MSARAVELYRAHRDAVLARTDRLLAKLLAVEWVFGIFVALFLSPYWWSGRQRSTHLHVYAAVLLGGTIVSLPLFLAWKKPGWVGTRHVIAVAQMLWAGLLIHLTGGRLETHFLIFGSLAFLAFYRDHWVLLPATIVVAADHFLRGILWPESVYGIANPEWWRFLEHAGWVVFEDAVLVIACRESVREMKDIAQQRADIEALSASEREKSESLDRALQALHDSQDARVRTERLAAVGQLAASVGHELRNPLAAVRNAATYIGKRLEAPAVAPVIDAKVPQFLAVIDREVVACTRIISDLLDFARVRSPVLQPCPLHALVEEAASLVQNANGAIKNAVSETLAVPSLDKEQFRQVFINLLQNAVEALPEGRSGEVVVRADGGGSEPLRITVTDDGEGIAPNVAAKIFEPLFTTKTKGTGLGLAVVANMIQGHRGTIRVESEPGHGATFVIELPPNETRVPA